jgi:hypothetical protein
VEVVEELPKIVCGDNQTSVVARPPAGAPEQKTYAHVCIPYLLFALCAALYVLVCMRLIFIGGDEGTIVTGAVRIMHGQVFARDFFEVIGPGSLYVVAGFFKMFGATFFVERIWLFITSLGTFLSMYFLSRRVCGKYQILPAVLLASVYFSTLWPMVNHHVDSNFFLLLAVVCIVMWQDKRKSGLLLAAGALAGLTTCFLQPKGMLLLLAFLAWLLIQRWRRSAPPSSIGVLVAGYFGVTVLVAIYFWSRGALWDLIYMNFVWPSQHYETVNAIAYARGISQYWNHWAIPIHGMMLLIPVAVILILPFLLVTALPALVIALGIPKGKENLRPEILLYWLCGSALWLSEIHRQDIAHLVVGSPLLIVLCVYFLAEYRAKIAELGLQFLAISAGALATVNLFIVLCAHSVPTRVGTIATFKHDAALAFLDNHVAPGTEIFVYPACPMYYFLSATANPTPYSLLIYNYNTAAQFQEVIRVLDQHKVRYVVWDTKFETKEASYFSASFNKPAGGQLMEPYLQSHYRLVRDFDGMTIMERKADNNGDQR